MLRLFDWMIASNQDLVSSLARQFASVFVLHRARRLFVDCAFYFVQKSSIFKPICRRFTMDPQASEQANDSGYPQKNKHVETRIIRVCSLQNVKAEWETDDCETISDWVKRNLGASEKDIEKLLFKAPDDAVINTGWNTSILSDDKGTTYNYEFRSMKQNMKSELCRKEFPHSIDHSKAASFKVVKCPVSKLHRFQKLWILQVHFLPGESLEEAISRDGRFFNQQLPSKYFLVEHSIEIKLELPASKYANQTLEFKDKKRSKRKATKEKTVIKPECATPVSKVKSEPGQSKDHFEETNVQDVASTSGVQEEISKVTKFTSDKEFSDFVYKIVLNVTGTGKHAFNKDFDEAAVKLFKANYDNYAMNHSEQLYTADHQLIVDVCNSVGAVLVKYRSGEIKFIGTCFRLGAHFVMTNNHVVEYVKEILAEGRSVVVHFGYKEDCPKLSREFICFPDPVVCSVDLDYAILTLCVEGEAKKYLPPSLTTGNMLALPSGDVGLRAGKFLYFAGHPGGDKTATNLCCPVRTPEALSDTFTVALSVKDKHWLANKNMANYDVSTFFEGSSGSPGFSPQGRMLLALHCRGVTLQGSKIRLIEQGVLMPAIIADVNDQIKTGELKNNYKFEDLFGVKLPESYPVPMDVE